jgi:ankyrin repeat protein
MTSSQNTDVNSGDGLALAMRLAATTCSNTHLNKEGVSKDHRDRPTAGKIYGGITAQDNSRMHAGDVYNIYNRPESSAADYKIQDADDAFQRMRAALAFPQMGGRSAIVEDAISNTCQWLFSTPEYESWCDPASYEKHHGFLWIRGKPGAGKSTAMKTLLNRAQSGRTGEKVLSFFFNARGEALERSTEGLYRSLLHQATASMSTLPPETTYGLESSSLESYKRGGWQIGVLKSLIKKIVLQLDRGHRWSCYIDALDEGDDEDDVRDMVEYLDELTETAHEQGLHLSVCLASRHYPNISVRCLEKLNLDDHMGHYQDIDTYVRRKAVTRDAMIPADVVTSIQKRSSGVFLWVVLVIAEVKKFVDHGNHHELRSLLDTIPDGVENLLDDIVKKAGPDGRLAAALQWASFALRPLTPKEFYTALMLSVGRLDRDSARWDRRINATFVHNFILSSSRGLLEIVASPQDHRPTGDVHFSLAPLRDDLFAGRVQFIHESVREYVLHGGSLKFDPTLRKIDLGSFHERLARWCCEYLNRTSCSALAKRLRPSTDHHEWWRLASNTFPLLRYALDGVLRHAESAAYHGSKQMPFSASFTFKDWLAVKSCIMGNSKTYPYHTSRSPSLLHVLVSEKCSHLVDIELSGASSNPSKELWAHLNATDLPYEEDVDFPSIESSNALVDTIPASCIGGALHIAVSNGSVEIARALIRSGADPNDLCRDFGSPLTIALENHKHRVDMVTMLLENGARPEENCTSQCRHLAGSRRSPLYDFAEGGDFKVVELLLRYGANPNVGISGHRTPLWIAIRHCHLDIVQVLLVYGADANATFPDCDKRVACNILVAAMIVDSWDCARYDSHINTKRLEMVNLLLKHGAIDVRCRRCKKTALDHAMRSGDQRLMDLLHTVMKMPSLNVGLNS